MGSHQAVILAAGRGTRLGGRGELMPKALLPIGPRSASDPTPTCFLRRQAELLLAAGVDQVVVVVGHLGASVAEAVAGWNLPLSLVTNTTTDMAGSGSLHSLQFAVKSPHGILDGSRATLVLDADIVYHPDALTPLLADPGLTSVLISEATSGDLEEVRVYGSAARPRFIGKGLTPEVVMGEPCLGEAVGIVQFATQHHALARATIDWMVGDPSAPEGSGRFRGYSPARQLTEHEELTQRFMAYGLMVASLLGAEMPFMECDDEADYARLTQHFYPDLIARG